MSIKIVITGSDKGSKIVWSFIKLMLTPYRIKLVFVSPSSKKNPKNFQGLILSGGVDIDPSIYGKKRYIKNGDKKRDLLELSLIEEAVKKEIPILGICRGMQLINVFFGGTLHYDINELDLNHPHSKTPLPLKTVIIDSDSHLYKILKRKKIKVNALHHQAIDILGKDLQIAAYDKNSITQAIEHIKNRYILGVQWHPEFIPFSKTSHKIFKHFIKYAKIYHTHSNIYI
ncbi:gamma-glutamyl-gamma-aminobutyrate hydrolase family protein [Nitrosophilus labii]|uniref:gamma-glutamyl-gamma-aminobutyrate hydrolase family protein n=1 Tax=Nitrosophilus labii TaxID=2706014 RepID=UPI001656D752|nr:gamma-glutamyl-gamma-aminobutyrate hydrolase family protein [Nitrosophilus labii]